MRSPPDRILARRTVARAWCLVVALAVLFGVIHARAHYFYCEGLGLSETDPCIHPVEHRPQCPLASFDRAPFDCCQVVSMPSMPEGSRSFEPTVPAPGVVAIVPALQRTADATWSESVRVAWEDERWRGPPRCAGERRAQLMVFLT